MTNYTKKISKGIKNMKKMSTVERGFYVIINQILEDFKKGKCLIRVGEAVDKSGNRGDVLAVLYKQQIKTRYLGIIYRMGDSEIYFDKLGGNINHEELKSLTISDYTKGLLNKLFKQIYDATGLNYKILCMQSFRQK